MKRDDMDEKVLIAALEDYGRNLGTLNASTEEDFLTIGVCLDKVARQAREVSGAASSSATLMSGPELATAMEQLKGVLGELNQYFGGVEGTLDGRAAVLGDILGLLKDIRQPLVGFKRVVKHLKVLGVSTKIESARLNSGNESFDSLAGDVEKLSLSIGEKSVFIMKGMEDLREVIQRALSDLHILKTVEEGQTEAILDNMSTSLAFLSDKYRSSSATAGIISGKSDAIGTQIGEIVSSLQFHDITRQQIDHVKETLFEVVAKVCHLEAEQEGGDQGSPSPFSSIGSVIGDVCDLQVKQLSSARDDLVGAVHNIMTSLEKVAGYTREITDETAHLLTTAGQTGVSFMDELARGISMVITSLEESSATVHKLSGAVQSVVHTIRDLAVFVSEIDGIGTEIELIALNARIKAARTGTEGAAMGILAEAIRNLSENARQQTDMVTRVLQRVSDLSLKLDSSQEGEKDPETHDGLTRAGEKMEGLVRGLRDFSDDLVSRVTSMEVLTRGLSRLIDETVRNVQVHYEVDHVLTDVAEGLRAFAGRLRQLDSRNGNGSRDDHFKDLLNRYTMHQERAIHWGHTTGDGENGAVAQEHFQQNVELF